MMLTLYRGLSAVAAPLIDAVLERRMAAGKEERSRIGERFGRTGVARPIGPLIWIHGASVGESLSVLSLIDRLLADYPALHILVTTGTVTSAALMAQRLPDRAFHQYAPVDRLSCVQRFLDHWRPDLALWIESEFWPNALTEMRRRGTKLVLVNARISPRAYSRWRWLPSLIRPILDCFDLCLAQSEAEAERLRKLGAKRVDAPGNLKFAAAPLPADGDELTRLSALTGTRPRWLASSTHAGEEDIVGRVHKKLESGLPQLLTIIVPRHPGRGNAIAESLRAQGLPVAQRSRGATLDSNTAIYIADTMGELGLFYRLCPIAFIGGSLIPHGGHNLIEPAQLGCAILHGPHMQNFREIADDMGYANAAITVGDEETLGLALHRLLADPAAASKLAQAAKSVADAKTAVLDRVMKDLAQFLSGITLRSSLPPSASAPHSSHARA
ncbi:MAG: 3-deoxy-D-manno-octulosonic acid transferase [Alphaproteobacteria bacterium]